jgi:cGMP-dependent protein kinase
MAPEIMNGKGYNLKCDLFSLGVCMYEFLCGGVPFGEDSEDPFTIYEEIMNTEKILFPKFLKDEKAKKLLV